MGLGKSTLVYVVVLASTLALVLSAFLAIGCGKRHGQVAQLSFSPPATEQPADNEEIGGVLPPVMALDGCIALLREVSEDDTITSPGWWAYANDDTGTNGTSGLNVEMDGTALTLRAYAPGEYAYAVYGQPIAETSKPLETQIKCLLGGGQDEDIPLYYVGLADYTLDTWRWFGPFDEEDVMVTVNSATLKRRFKSPDNNFYLCVLATVGSKATSALPKEGLVADFPIELHDRAVSAEDDEPDRVTIREICTWVRDNLYTEPAVLTGLRASASLQGVTLNWDKNPDPDVDIYQIFRTDPDTEEPLAHIASVFAPDTDFSDSVDDPQYPSFLWDVGVPGKEYKYSVRARNDAGYGGYYSPAVTAARGLVAPIVTASDGKYSDHVQVDWTTSVEGAVGVEGAISYSIQRSDTVDGARSDLAQVDAAMLSYDDNSVEFGTTYYYWVRAIGEDIEGPLGWPDAGYPGELGPGDVQATAGDYPDRVELVWGEVIEEPLPDEYNVYRDTDEEEADAELIAVVTAPEHAYTDTTVPWDEPRFYFVKPVVLGAEQPRGEGEWGHRGLRAPTDVTATQGTFAGKVVVSWSAVNHATRYRVYRSVTADDPDPEYLNEVVAPTTSYDNTTAGWSVTEGVHYFYFIAALHAGPDNEASSFDEPAEGWRGIGVPANVSVTDGTKTDSVNISWNAVSQATHYRVYRSTVEYDPAPALLGAVAAPSMGYTDSTAAHDILYWYSVSAVYSDDEGARSDVDSGYRGMKPPLNVLASNDLEDSIEITWDSVTGATGYAIYRAETETGTYTQVGTDDASPYTDGPFEPDTAYWYKLKATNSLATSAFSNADNGNTG